MVTIQDAVQYVNGVACTTQKVWCKSTDVKPTEGIGNGSQLREMDTGKDYAFDAESGEWLEQPEEGGGGGGGGGAGAGPLVVEFQEDSDYLNKTGQEIKDAFLNSAVFLVYGDSTEMASERCEHYGIHENVHVFIFESKNSENRARCTSLSDYPLVTF